MGLVIAQTIVVSAATAGNVRIGFYALQKAQKQNQEDEAAVAVFTVVGCTGRVKLCRLVESAIQQIR